MRQIFYIKKSAEKGIRNNWEWQAKLQGKELKSAQMRPLDLPKKQDEFYDNEAKKMLARMQKKYGERSRIKDKDNRII